MKKQSRLRNVKGKHTMRSFNNILPDILDQYAINVYTGGGLTTGGITKEEAINKIYHALLEEVIGEDEDDEVVFKSVVYNEVEALQSMVIRNKNRLRTKQRQKLSEFCGVEVKE